jgi:hypothetical protein
VPQELVRTCSAAEAAVLSRAIGHVARIGSTWVCIREPKVSLQVEADRRARCRVRVEVLEPGDSLNPVVPGDATKILTALFGLYLD